jgi:hypothetical protein
MPTGTARIRMTPATVAQQAQPGRNHMPMSIPADEGRKRRCPVPHSLNFIGGFS